MRCDALRLRSGLMDPALVESTESSLCHGDRASDGGKCSVFLVSMVADHDEEARRVE